MQANQSIFNWHLVHDMWHGSGEFLDISVFNRQVILKNLEFTTQFTCLSLNVVDKLTIVEPRIVYIIFLVMLPKQWFLFYDIFHQIMPMNSNLIILNFILLSELQISKEEHKFLGVKQIHAFTYSDMFLLNNQHWMSINITEGFWLWVIYFLRTEF